MGKNAMAETFLLFFKKSIDKENKSIIFIIRS